MSSNNSNLVYIGPLWGTPEQKSRVGEHERFELPEHVDICRFRIRVGEICIVDKPTWTWCESPTDEMARKRPRCEVRDRLGVWEPGTLLAVDPVSDGQPRYTARNQRDGDVPWQFCRVRIDANGDVMENWED